MEFPSRLILTAVIIISIPASAGSIYKCKTPDGRTKFLDQPCPATDQPQPVLSGRGATSSLGAGTSYSGRNKALQQLRAMEQIRQSGREPGWDSEPTYSGRQNDLSYEERLQLRNNKVERRSLESSRHGRARMRGLDREDEAIRGRAYVPDPEPAVIYSYPRRYYK